MASWWQEATEEELIQELMYWNSSLEDKFDRVELDDKEVLDVYKEGLRTYGRVLHRYEFMWKRVYGFRTRFGKNPKWWVTIDATVRRLPAKLHPIYTGIGRPFHPKTYELEGDDSDEAFDPRPLKRLRASTPGVGHSQMLNDQDGAGHQSNTQPDIRHIEELESANNAEPSFANEPGTGLECNPDAIVDSDSDNDERGFPAESYHPSEGRKHVSPTVFERSCQADTNTFQQVDNQQGEDLQEGDNESNDEDDVEESGLDGESHHPTTGGKKPELIQAYHEKRKRQERRRASDKTENQASRRSIFDSDTHAAALEVEWVCDWIENLDEVKKIYKEQEERGIQNKPIEEDEDVILCGRTFKTKAKGQRHVLDDHVPEKRHIDGQFFTCQMGICKHSFKSEDKSSVSGNFDKNDKLKSHIRAVLDVREYGCKYGPECTHRTNRKTDITQHQKRCRYNPAGPKYGQPRYQRSRNKENDEPGAGFNPNVAGKRLPGKTPADPSAPPKAADAVLTPSCTGDDESLRKASGKSLLAPVLLDTADLPAGYKPLPSQKKKSVPWVPGIDRNNPPPAGFEHLHVPRGSRLPILRKEIALREEEARKRGLKRGSDGKPKQFY
ncbi:hypothetical protein ABW19_dt0201254 [Dactylella cylindrospora]|nr:hypothetical protein ABW19_dt0201254 [Dactylella cylindrospora]